MSARFIFSLLFIFGLEQHSVRSYSACDPTDVFFLVDTASVIADSDGLIKLIESVINSGSSEETGFSVIIWGDDVPLLQYGVNSNNDNSILCEISETTSTHNRPKQIEIMDGILKDAFDKIKDGDSAGYISQDISFENALKSALEESKSDDRQHINSHVHGDSVGLNDDEDIFMVFDYDNFLGEETKKYIDRFENNPSQSIHFIFGQGLHIANNTDKDEAEKTKFKIEDPSEAALKTHFFKFDLLVNDIGDDGVHSMWDQFLDLTCPATIVADEKGSKLGLGNHVQYIEADTIISCDIVKDTETAEMDASNSFLTVRDDLDDKSTATFNIGDFLFIDPETHHKLPPDCDQVGVVKVIQSTVIHSDKENTANILKLQIKEPDDIMEYITSGKFEGKVNPERNTDNSTYSNDSDSDSIERRRMLGGTYGYRWTYAVSYTETKGTAFRKTKNQNGATWVFEATGKMTATARTTFTLGGDLYLNIDAGLYWNYRRVCWCWSPWSGWGCCHNIRVPWGFYLNFHVRFMAGYWLTAYLKLDFEAQAKAHMPRALYRARDAIAWIGHVPVKYRVWFQIDALMETVPIYASAWIDCSFSHRIYIGYEYRSGGGGRGAYILGPYGAGSNGCSKGWSVGEGNKNVPKKIGLDTTIDAIAGFDFYKSVSGQFIAEFKAPLYIELTSQSSGCKSWGPCNRNLKPAIITFQIDFQPMWRIVFDTAVVVKMGKALAASILGVFGISVPDLGWVTSDKIGHVDKSKCSKIGGPIRLYTAPRQCFDTSSMIPSILIDRYCTGYAYCHSYYYSSWSSPACNGVSAQIGYDGIDDFDDVGGDVDDVVDVVDFKKFADNSTIIQILLIGYLFAAILCCINISIYIKRRNGVKYEKIAYYSSNEENNQSV